MKSYRPAYHYLPRKNWINDPCGLIQYHGTYHLYYQHNPNGDYWGDMHWGHAISKDLVDWQEQPIALHPDLTHGEDHCFTGCGGRLPNGRPVFYYTSISHQRPPEQWLAFPEDDTLSAIHQTAENALRLSMHGPEMKISEWRDPNVIPYKGGYLMVLGCQLDDHGASLLYTSEDGIHFTYHSVLAQADGSEDRSWECPNFFPLGDKYVLLYSPYRHPVYIVGTLTDDLRFFPESKGILDESGHEGHYAPQTFKDEQGRQLLMNWLTERSRGIWKGIEGWAGCQGLPKELYLDGNILKMRIIPEIEKLVVSREIKQLPLSRYEAGEQYRVQIDAVLEEDGSVEVELLSTADGKEKTMICVHGNGRMVVDRLHSSVHPTHHSLLERRISLPDGQATLEIYVDHSVIEACGNGEWISTRVYPASEDAVGLAVGLKAAKGSCTVSQMRACEK